MSEDGLGLPRGRRRAKAVNLLRGGRVRQLVVGREPIELTELCTLVAQQHQLSVGMAEAVIRHAVEDGQVVAWITLDESSALARARRRTASGAYRGSL